MKKFLAGLLVMIVLAAALPATVYAAASASLTGPSVVRAGDTITLSFSAGGGIYGGNGSISFDSSQLTLQGYSCALSAPWTMNFNGNTFIFYDDSMVTPINGSKTIFTATFKVNSSVAAGTTISVQAQGIVLSDGSGDSGIGSRTYSVTVLPPLSNNANLASLQIANAGIYPAFSWDTTEYSCSVPYRVSSLDISAVAEHAGASVQISNNYLTADDTTRVTVTVTAENGATKKYYIYAYREQDPNYVPSADNTLYALSVEGFQLSPAFSSEQQDYAVYLPYEVDAIFLSASYDGKASLTTPATDAIPVGTTVYELPVTAENGEVRIYTLTVYRADVFPPMETQPEETEPTEPVTEPTEPATEPAEPATQPTEPATEPATEATAEPTSTPTEAPIQPAPDAKKPSSASPVLWSLGVIAAFAAGCCITSLVFLKKKKTAK